MNKKVCFFLLCQELLQATWVGEGMMNRDDSSNCFTERAEHRWCMWMPWKLHCSADVGIVQHLHGHASPGAISLPTWCLVHMGSCLLLATQTYCGSSSSFLSSAMLCRKRGVHRERTTACFLCFDFCVLPGFRFFLPLSVLASPNQRPPCSIDPKCHPWILVLSLQLSWHLLSVPC